MKPATFLIPGVFLLILGTGNALIGSMKTSEYATVVSELSAMEHAESPSIVDSSPMTRLKLARQVTQRLDERRRNALAKREFYYLVMFGGQIFVGISLLFLLVGIFMKFRRAPEPAPGVPGSQKSIV